MFLKFSTKRELIFLDSHASHFYVEDKVDVILSPELYWVKKVTLPVKNTREVKPLVESLFEGTLPDAEYSYSVYKQDDFFYIFAYQDKVILDLLDSKGILTSQVHNVYFSQSEFCDVEIAIELNANQSMYMKEGILILVPSLWVEHKTALSLEDKILSKHYIVLKQYKHLINEKYIYIIAGVLSLLILISGVEYLIIKNKIFELETKREALFKASKLKPTMMQSRAMLSEYKSLHVQQKSIREKIGKLLAIDLHKGEKISYFSFKKNKMSISFTGLNSARQKNIQTTLKQKNITFKAKEFDVTLSLVITL